MCVNKIKLKTANKNNHLSIRHSQNYKLLQWDSIFWQIFFFWGGGGGGGGRGLLLLNVVRNDS